MTAKRQARTGIFRIERVFGVAALALVLWGGHALYTEFWDFGPAAGELPQAIAAYRAAGLPWTAADLAPEPPIAPGDDAAPLLGLAIDEIRLGGWVDRSAELTKAAEAGEWTSVERELRSRRVALARLEQAAKRPRSSPVGDPDLGWEAPSVGAPDLNAGVRTLAARAIWNASRGRKDEALRDLHRIRTLARLFDEFDSYPAPGVWVRFERMALSAARTIAARDPGFASTLLREIERHREEPGLRPMLRTAAYACVASFRNDGAEAMEGSEAHGSLFAGVSPPSSPRRDGVPPGGRAKACLARTLQFWTRAEPVIRRYEHDPVRSGPALDAVLQETLARKGRSFRFSAWSIMSMENAGDVIVELRVDRAITIATLRALDARHLTGRWPKTLISGNDPYGRPYLGRYEGEGFRIVCFGKNGVEDRDREPSPSEKPVPRFVTWGYLSSDIVGVYRPRNERRSGTAQE